MVAMTCEPWITGADIPNKYLRDAPEQSDVRVAIQVASGIMWALTGRRWRGGCERVDVELHVGCACADLLPTESWAVRVGYDSRTLEVNDWGSPWHALRLPDDPIAAVSALSGPGGVIDLANVGIRRNRDLWLKPFGTAWLRGDYLTSYTFGVLPPEELKYATGILAGELIMGKAGASGCRLPDRVQNITRQGVSITLLDPLTFLDKGRTGIGEVDLMVAAVNPGALTQRPRVYSPDLLDPVQSRPASP